MTTAMWVCAVFFFMMTATRWLYLLRRINFAYSLRSGYGHTVLLILQALVCGVFNGLLRGTEHQGGGVVPLLFVMCEGWLFSYLVKKKWKEDAEYIP